MRRRTVGKQPVRRRIVSKRPARAHETSVKRRIRGKQTSAKAASRPQLEPYRPAIVFAATRDVTVSTNSVQASDPVSQFSPRVPEVVPLRSAMSEFRSIPERSGARAKARPMGEPVQLPRQRQATLTGERMRRRISRQETFVSEPLDRMGPLPRLPVRPVSVNAPTAQFRQLQLHDVICNQQEVVDLSLERWHEMGMNEL